MPKSLSIKLLISVMVLALVAAACGGAESTETAADVAPTATSDPVAEEATETEQPEATGVDTAAATLTRDLTGLLDDHEYLAGSAVYAAVTAGGDLEDPTFTAAAKALDNNTQQLADTIGSVYGDDAAAQFADLWRKHIGFFVDYTLGQATNDSQMAAVASEALDGYRADFGAFIEGATEGALPQDAVATALAPHVNATKKAIDAVVSGERNGFEQLRRAGGHMPHIATALAGGIAQQQGLEGKADSGPSQLQAGLTHELMTHEYLAGIAVLTAVEAGGDLEDPTFTAAATALDNNSTSLAAAIERVYGPEGGKQFLDLWRGHIGFFVNYTLGKASGDEQLQDKARRNLDGYRADFGAFIEGATEGGLTQDAVADALAPHVESTIAAIDAVVTGDGNGFELLRQAAGHMPGIATALSGAIVQQFPDQF
jgi:hypothetical protein